MDLDDIVFGGILGGFLFSGDDTPPPSSARSSPEPQPVVSKSNVASSNSFLGSTYNPKRKYTGRMGKASVKSRFIKKRASMRSRRRIAKK